MKQLIPIATVLAMLAAPACAQPSGADHAAHHPAQAQNTAALTDGEIRCIDKVKTGEKVKFRAEKEGGNYIVTIIEPVK